MVGGVRVGVGQSSIAWDSAPRMTVYRLEEAGQ